MEEIADTSATTVANADATTTKVKTHEPLLFDDYETNLCAVCDRNVDANHEMRGKRHCRLGQLGRVLGGCLWPEVQTATLPGATLTERPGATALC
jgi:hypothetical protein